MKEEWGEIGGRRKNRWKASRKRVKKMMEKRWVGITQLRREKRGGNRWRKRRRRRKRRKRRRKMNRLA